MLFLKFNKFLIIINNQKIKKKKKIIIKTQKMKIQIKFRF